MKNSLLVDQVSELPVKENTETLKMKVDYIRKHSVESDTKIERAHRSDLKHIKQQYARELQNIIDKEVAKAK